MRGKRVFRYWVAVLAGLLVLTGGCRGEVPGTAPPGAPATPGGSAPARPGSLTVAAAGDLLIHPELTAQAAADARADGRGGHDFTGLLAAVAPVLREADLAICHLEQPLAEPAGPFTGWPLFNAPPELADAAAAAGFDTCSTASNHALDAGLDGIRRTLDNLDRVGLAHTGTARSEPESRQVNLLDVAGVPVAQLSYTFSFNGIPLPESAPWAANLLEGAETVRVQARRAREAGAEIVIASLHWGTEYQVAADPGQTGLAAQLLNTPEIDLIVGHHAHVVQPFERIGDKWVAYGLGNLTARFPDGSPEQTQDSAVPVFTFTETAPGKWRVTGVEVVPTWIEYEPQPRVVNLPAALAGELSPQRRATFQRAWERIAGQINQRGAEPAGLRVVAPAVPAAPPP